MGDDVISRVEDWLDVLHASGYSKSYTVLVADLRELLALARSNSWQTIETAPKDGTEIIIGWLKDGAVRGASKAKWVSADFWADLEGGEPDEFVAGWYEPNYEDELCANVWIPLPSPPDTGDQK